MKLHYIALAATTLGAGIAFVGVSAAGGSAMSRNIPAAVILARARTVALATSVLRYRESYAATDIYMSGTWRRRHMLSAVASMGQPNRFRSTGLYHSDPSGLSVASYRGPIRFVTVGEYTAQRRGRRRWTCEKDELPTGAKGSYSNPIGPLWFPSQAMASRAHVKEGRGMWVVSTELAEGKVGPHGMPEVYMAARYWIDARTYRVRRMTSVGRMRDRQSGEIRSMGRRTLTMIRCGGRVPNIHLPAGACQDAS